MEWWQAYLLTLAVELPIMLVSLRAARLIGPGGLTWPTAAALVWTVNLTHPILWWVHPVGWSLLAAEFIVALVEGLILWLGCRRVPRAGLICLLVAGSANTASLLFGLVI